MKRKVKKHVPQKRTYSRKKREQKVKFRRRYAASIFKTGLKQAVTFTKVAAIGVVVGGGGLWASHFWNNSTLLKIKEVAYEGERPSGLSSLLNLKEGQNIFQFKAGSLEKEALARFPELRGIDIDRSFNGRVTVQTQLRIPLAIYGPKGRSWAVDSQGEIFPLTPAQAHNLESIPVVEQAKGIQEAGAFLEKISSGHPWFYEDLKTLKTDRMSKVSLTMKDGTALSWGEIHPEETGIKIEKWKTVRERFKPGKGATARFVDPTRIVLNSKWE